jgi:hypothetical protein
MLGGAMQGIGKYFKTSISLAERSGNGKYSERRGA